MSVSSVVSLPTPAPLPHTRPLFLGEGWELELADPVGGRFAIIAASPHRLEVVVPEQVALFAGSGSPVEGVVLGPAGVRLPVKGVVAVIAQRELRRQPVRVVTLSLDGGGGELSRISEDADRNQCHPCPEIYRPLAWCQNPLFFGESLHFQVFEMGARGLGLVTPLRHPVLLPGLRLELRVAFSLVGEHSVAVEVRWVTEAPGGGFRLGVRFVEPSTGFLEALSEYLLLASPGLSLDELRREGLRINGIGRALVAGYAQSQAEWEEVLALRFLSYRGAGKFPSARAPADMADAFDDFARQLVVRLGGRVAGAIRVVFPDGLAERSEHAALGIAIPKWLWERRFVEISRACTDPACRGSDVFVALMQHAGRIAIEDGCTHILANCNPELWPLYRKVGFEKLGVRFSAFGRDDCELLALDLQKLCRGLARNPLFYNVVFFPLAEYLHRRGMARVGVVGGLLLRIHGWLYPIFQRLHSWSRRRNDERRAKGQPPSRK